MTLTDISLQLFLSFLYLKTFLFFSFCFPPLWKFHLDSWARKYVQNAHLLGRPSECCGFQPVHSHANALRYTQPARSSFTWNLSLNRENAAIIEKKPDSQNLQIYVMKFKGKQMAIFTETGNSCSWNVKWPSAVRKNIGASLRSPWIYNLHLEELT